MTQIRRVPLDFDWPLHQVWGGFRMPESLRLPPCPDCTYDGHSASGYSPAAWGIAETFYALDVPEPVRSRIAWFDKITQAEVDYLIEQGRLPTWETGAYVDERGHARTGRWVAVPRTAEEVNAAQDTPGSMGHDALNRMLLIRFRCERLGIDLYCPTCRGTCHGGTPDQVAAHEAWQPTPVPVGEGWQAWEDISEGSPISPVFADREGLIDWFTDPHGGYATRLGPLTRSEAEALVDAGASIGSGITIQGSFVDGDRAVAALGPAGAERDS